MNPTRPEPADFDLFWAELASRARSIDPELTLDPAGDDAARVVRFTSLDGVRVGARLVLPPGEPTSVVLVGHGYGGYSGLDLQWAPEGAAVFQPMARGLPDLSVMPGIPAESDRHVLHGIEAREAYVLGGCSADLVWCALNALEQILDRPVGHRHGGMPAGFYSTSFGGGIGALAAPWDDRLDAVALHVPTFGGNPERLAAQSLGSSAALAAYAKDHPEVWGVLDYFDAATTARRFAVPTLIAPAGRDPVVPPVGQWAIARAVPEAVRAIVPMSNGHLDMSRWDAQEVSDLSCDVRALFRGIASVNRTPERSAGTSVG